MNYKPYLIAVFGLSMLGAITANAALVLDYSSTDAEQHSAKISDSSTLLLNNDFQWATLIGKCEVTKLVGSARNVSFANGLKMIIPRGWKVFADDGIVFEDKTLSWASGDIWTDVLARFAENEAYQVKIDCSTKEIQISGSPDLGSLASRDLENNFDNLAELEKTGHANGSEVLQKEPAVPKSSSNPSPQEKVSSSNQLIPYTGETIYSFMNRYAVANGFGRVVYRTRDINKIGTTKIEPKSWLGDTSKFNLDLALDSKGLIALTGSDAATKENVIIVTDEKQLQNRAVRVFSVNEQLLSTNSLKLASIYGLNFGPSNEWPIDADYKVPFVYDIVITDALDAFSQLFKQFPVQARLIQGGNSMTVVKRSTGKRHSSN